MIMTFPEPKNITVSFFKNLSVKSYLTQRLFAYDRLNDLVVTIYNSMNGDENYACFLRDDGYVIALDKSGRFVMM